MNTKYKTHLCAAIVFGLALSAFAFSSIAQTGEESSGDRIKRLKSPATETGHVGGESHDSYVVRARKGQTIKVQISWQSEDNNKAQFVVSRSADFFAGDLVEGATETYDGKKWWRKIPKTGDLYIYVTAHPQAIYQLKVTVK